MQSARQDLGKLGARILNGADPAEAVVLAWPLVCGSAVAERAKALTFANGTLWVRVPDQGWQSQLQAFSEQYLHRLTALTGSAVKRIAYDVSSSPSPVSQAK